MSSVLSEKFEKSSLKMKDDQSKIGSIEGKSNICIDKQYDDKKKCSYPKSDEVGQQSSTIDLDESIDRTKNMSSFVFAKTRENISRKRISSNSKNKRYNQGLAWYYNEDIIEENETSPSNSTGSSSGVSSGYINDKKNRPPFNRRALKELPAIPQEKTNINTNNGRITRKSEIDNIIADLKFLVNESNPRDKYACIKQIAEGRFGRCIVCSAKNILTNEDVAIKIQSIGINDGKYLKVELTILNGKQHPNLIKYYDSYIVNKNLWTVMEQIHGGPLCYLIEEVDLFEEDVKIISKEILKGLEFLHENQIIHRDIKSNNILISRDGEVKIIDFGLSAKLKYLDEKKDSNVGNDYYKSPEVIAGKSHNNKTDIWSFGILVNEMQSGSQPFFSCNSKKDAADMILKYGPPPLGRKASDELQEFYDKCVERDPEKRASSAQLLKHKFLKSTSPTSLLAPKMRKALKQKRNVQIVMYQ